MNRPEYAGLLLALLVVVCAFVLVVGRLVQPLMDGLP